MSGRGSGLERVRSALLESRGTELAWSTGAKQTRVLSISGIAHASAVWRRGAPSLGGSGCHQSNSAIARRDRDPAPRDGNNAYK
jgi:hypothetical protein